MSNFIIERSVVDKIIVENKTFERKISFKFDTSQYEIIWYEFSKGRKQIKDTELYSKLEQLYRDKRDRVHGCEK